MSLNPSMKIVKGEEIRKIHRLPSNWQELQEILQNLFGSSSFKVSYQDEEGDVVTITDTEQLLDVYDQFRDRPSIKLMIKEAVPEQHGSFEESQRQAKLQSIKDRFPHYASELQNPEFQDFLQASAELVSEKREVPGEKIAHDSEEFKEQGHPFGNAREPQNQWRNEGGCRDPSGREDWGNWGNWGNWRGGWGRGRGCGRGRRGFKWMEQIQPFIQQFVQNGDLGEIAQGFMKKMKNKVKLVEHVTLKKDELIPLNIPVTKVWKVKNNGMMPWPAGLKLVFLKGNIQPLDEQEVGEVQPGDVVEIEATCMLNAEGPAKGVWALQGEQSFGKLKLKVEGVDVEAADLEKVKQLVKMGFTIQQAKDGLRASEGDMGGAVSHIFSTI